MQAAFAFICDTLELCRIKKKFFNLNLHFTPHLNLTMANILAIVANNIVHWIHVNKKPKIKHNTTVMSRMKNMRV